MKQVLVLCTGNSCRSQMAEAYLRVYASDKAEIYSAGVEIHGLNTRAVAVMKADGIDISGHTSNNLNEYSHIPFDAVITVCDNAKESCPVFPGRAQKFHQNFPDPAKATGSEADVMAEFARVRNQIKDYSRQWAEANL